MYSVIFYRKLFNFFLIVLFKVLLFAIYCRLYTATVIFGDARASGAADLNKKAAKSSASRAALNYLILNNRIHVPDSLNIFQSMKFSQSTDIFECFRNTCIEAIRDVLLL